MMLDKDVTQFYEEKAMSPDEGSFTEPYHGRDRIVDKNPPENGFRGNMDGLDLAQVQPTPEKTYRGPKAGSLGRGEKESFDRDEMNRPGDRSQGFQKIPGDLCPVATGTQKPLQSASRNPHPERPFSPVARSREACSVHVRTGTSLSRRQSRRVLTQSGVEPREGKLTEFECTISSQHESLP